MNSKYYYEIIILCLFYSFMSNILKYSTLWYLYSTQIKDLSMSPTSGCCCIVALAHNAPDIVALLNSITNILLLKWRFRKWKYSVWVCSRHHKDNTNVTLKYLCKGPDDGKLKFQ